jgi:transposase-like protein
VKYSQDLKNAAVRLVVDGKFYTQMSKELRISPQSVRIWHTRFLAVGHCKNKKNNQGQDRA